MMAKKLSYFLIAISILSELKAQDWEFIQKQDVGQEITSCDIGALGKLYVGTSRGNVYSFLSDGTPDRHFSSSVFQPVTDLDASNSLRIFVFFKDAGQFEYLERFASQPRTYQLEDFDIESADHAALDDDGTIWFLSRLRLIHVNVFNRAILSEQILPNTLIADSIADMAYDRRLILADKQNGILFWDGGSLSHEPRPLVGVKSFDVFGNELIALGEQWILIWNQQTGEKEWLEPPRNDFDRVLKTGDVFHFIRGSEIYSYQSTE